MDKLNSIFDDRNTVNLFKIIDFKFFQNFH